MNESKRNDIESEDIEDDLPATAASPEESNTALELGSNIIDKDVEIDQLRKTILKYERLLERSNRYNDDLRKELSVLSSELHQYRNKCHSYASVCTQVSQVDIEEAYGNKTMPDWGSEMEPGTDGLSIADKVKAAAEELHNQLENHKNVSLSEQGQHMAEASSEYTYDNTTGLYYHAASGYYWDPNFCLFYDYTTGTYYKHNENTGEYEVYSRVDVDVRSQENQASIEKVKTQENKLTKRSKDREAARLKSKIKLKKYKQAKELVVATRDKRMGKNSMKIDETDEGGGSVSKEKENNSEESCVVDEEDEIMECDSEFSGSLATGESELSSEPESGEVISDSSLTDDELLPLDDSAVVYESTEITEDNPPCIRVMVQNSDHLKCGSLYIITCAGGTIGRESNKGHAIEISDVNVSKLHAEIVFDYEKHCYMLTDKNSQNGTFLSGNRISQNSSHDLKHDDSLQIGSTMLLLHIHKGHETCDNCEPGQVQAKIKAENPIKNDYIIMSQEEKNRQRRKELKNIKKKYGLQNCSYENPGIVVKNSDYSDKAYQRRKLIGSTSDTTEPNTSPSSVENSISVSNKGHKMLSKMGWKEGQGLGKSNCGIVEPINVLLRVNQNAGLGSTMDVSMSLDNVQNVGKAKRWAQAKMRYQKLEETTSQPLEAGSYSHHSTNPETTSLTEDHHHPSCLCDNKHNDATVISDKVSLPDKSLSMSSQSPAVSSNQISQSLQAKVLKPTTKWVKGDINSDELQQASIISPSGNELITADHELNDNSAS